MIRPLNTLSCISVLRTIGYFSTFVQGNGDVQYQQFAIPQNPDKRAAYGRHERGHPDVGETVLCWMLMFESDDDIVLPDQYVFRLTWISRTRISSSRGDLNGLRTSEAGHGVRRLGDFEGDCEPENFNEEIGVSRR